MLPINASPPSIVLDVAGQGARNFNFDVEFFVRGLDKEVQRFHYLVTTVSKPTFDLQHDEINQYGFRYNLLTGIRYGDISMTIIDDVDNKSLDFLRMYLNNIITPQQTDGPAPLNPNTRFNNDNVLSILDEDPTQANITALGGSFGSGVIIQEIKVHQYVTVGFDLSARNRIRTWTYSDPQLTNIDMQEFNVESDEIGTFTLSFNYKNVVMHTDGSDYPDTPFELLRAAAYADAAAGAIQSPTQLIKAIPTAATGLAVSEFNQRSPVPGLAAGGFAASTRNTNFKKNASTAPITNAIDSEKAKNGYTPSPSPAPVSENVTKTTPTAAEQAIKLGKL